MERPFIITRKLEKSFDSKPVLRGVSIEVNEGETMVVLGGSGAGKSVFLRHLNGLLRPDAGEVIVAGARLNELSEYQLGAVRKQVAMVFQSSALFDSLTVYENVSFLLSEQTGYGENRARERVRELLEMLELEGTEELYPAELSGGMKKRVALARALALQPQALLYDEPTSGLDPIVARKISLLMRDLQTRLGLTSVAVTHDLRTAFMVGDRFALLHDGNFRVVGTETEIRCSHDELMREFLAAAA